MKTNKYRNAIIKYFPTLLPAMLWMIGFFVIPLLFIVIVSFSTRGEVGNIVYKFTLSNYTKLLNPLYINIFFMPDIIVSAFSFAFTTWPSFDIVLYTPAKLSSP